MDTEHQPPPQSTEADVYKLIHELQARQTQLEAQNEELRLALERAEQTARKNEQQRRVAPADLFKSNRQETAEGMRLEASLKEYEQLYHSMFERNQAVKLLIDPKDGSIVDANSAAAAFYGYSVRQLKSLNVRDINTLPADKIKSVMTDIGNGRQSYFKFHHRLASGEIRDVEVHSSPVEIRGRVLHHAIIHDITERALVETALRSRDKEFRMLAEAMPQIVWIARAEGGNTYLNQQWVEYTGLTLEESHNRGWTKAFHPDDRRRALDAWRNAVTNVHAYSLECRLGRKDGVYRWWLVRGVPVLNEAGELLKWFGTCTDIDEIKVAEEALRTSEERYRLLFETMAQGVVYHNVDGTIMDANSAAQKILGLTLAQMQGRTSADPRWKAIHEDGSDFDGASHPANIALRTGKPVQSTLMGVYNPAIDQYRWINVSAMPRFHHGESKPFQVYTTFEDITARKAAEDEMSRLVEQTQQDALTKMELLNEVNHRVKNNLMMILGLILAEKRRARRDGCEDLDMIWENFENRIHGLLTVHQMLSNSRWKSMNLAQLVENICEGVLESNSYAGPAIKLCIDRSDIEISPRQANNLALVFNELLTNSLKYAFHHIAQPLVAVTIRKEGESASIEYRDNGAGYSNHVLTGGKYNVGLKMIHQLVEDTLGGEFSLMNNKGAVVKMCIPIEEQRSLPAAFEGFTDHPA